MASHPSRLPVLVAIVALAWPALAAAAGVSSHPTTTTTASSATPGNASMGKRLFELQQCGTCHLMAAANALDGDGAGPDLDHVTKTYAQIVTQITDGGHGMTPYKGVLTTAQIDDLANFIYTTSHPK